MATLGPVTRAASHLPTKSVTFSSSLEKSPKSIRIARVESVREKPPSKALKMDQTKIKWFTFKTTLKAKRKVMMAREKTLRMQMGMKITNSDTKKANIPLKTEPSTVASG